jgi:hypothetical protein
MVGACVLLVGGFGLTLHGAGLYQSLRAVRVGIVVGTFPAYFFVLWAASWICQRVQGNSDASRPFASLLLLSVMAGFATFLAPLIPSAVPVWQLFAKVQCFAQMLQIQFCGPV